MQTIQKRGNHYVIEEHRTGVLRTMLSRIALMHDINPTEKALLKQISETARAKTAHRSSL